MVSSVEKSICFARIGSVTDLIQFAENIHRYFAANSPVIHAPLAVHEWQLIIGGFSGSVHEESVMAPMVQGP